jgi:hypothetical protein
MAVTRSPEPPHPTSHVHPRVAIISYAPGEQTVLVAQFNPSQLQLEEGASYTPSASKTDEKPPLEYSATRPRSLSLELFFDAYEEAPGQRNVKKRFVEPLSRLLQVIEPGSSDEALLRPPLVELRWGNEAPFRGVLESMSTKLTMFLEDGTPVRATCAIKMMEASRESFETRPRNRVAAPRRAGS